MHALNVERPQDEENTAMIPANSDIELLPGDAINEMEVETYTHLMVDPTTNVLEDRRTVALRDPKTGALYTVDGASVIAVLT